MGEIPLMTAKTFEIYTRAPLVGARAVNPVNSLRAAEIAPANFLMFTVFTAVNSARVLLVYTRRLVFIHRS